MSSASDPSKSGNSPNQIAMEIARAVRTDILTVLTTATRARMPNSGRSFSFSSVEPILMDACDHPDAAIHPLSEQNPNPNSVSANIFEGSQSDDPNQIECCAYCPNRATPYNL
ncbi:MAG: hypothetical protein ACI875_001522 [Planctomycetota bacterium]|jgi:hypothetical protein